jgi:hypothetical protein
MDAARVVAEIRERLVRADSRLGEVAFDPPQLSFRPGHSSRARRREHVDLRESAARSFLVMSTTVATSAATSARARIGQAGQK